MRAHPLGAVVVTLALAGVLPGTAAGQGVTYTSKTSFHMGGALGALVRLGAKAGGAGDGSTTTYIEGHRMRTDARDNSTIIDVDAGRMTMIDNAKKTYSSMTFAEMADYMKQAQAKMQEARSQQAAEQKKAPEQKPHDDIEMSYNVSAENTGRHEKIAGFDAQQQLITMTMTARDKSQPTTQQDSGTLVVLMDIWTSKDAPNAAAMREFQRAYAARARTELAPAARGMASGMTSMLGSNPRLKAALEAAGKELQKVQGAQLRTTTYIVGVPEGVKFDPNLVLSGSGTPSRETAENSAPKQGGLKSLFGKVKAAAEQAERDQNQSSSKPAQQGTLLSFGTEMQDIRSGVPAGAFSVPAGYTEVPRVPPAALSR